MRAKENSRPSGRPQKKAALMLRRPFAAARSALRRWPRAVSGNVTIEFGFAITMLVVLALGTFDFGRLGLRKITVSNAARAGAEYGTQDFGTATDVNGIIQAARNDADDTNNSLNIAARQYCSCPTDGEIACTAMCSDGTFNLMYVEVSVQDQVDLVFPYPGVTSPRAIVSTSKMRVR